MRLLGLRARNSRHFRWTVGMRDLDGRVVLAEALPNGCLLWGTRHEAAYWSEPANAVPDLDHTGTLAEVFDLVMIAHDRHDLNPCLVTDLGRANGWYLDVPGVGSWKANRKAEVIVSALEAAP